MDCYAKDYCKKYNSEVCNEFCDVFVVLDAIYLESNIPKLYRKDHILRPGNKDLDNYKKLNEYKLNVVNEVEEGRGLYLYSRGTGNGKTSWVTKIANYYIRKIVFKREIEDKVYFITVPTFLEDLRGSYSDNKDYNLSKLYDCKLLILDDIGSEKPSEWVKERLFSIIDHRVNNELCTLYTSNLDLDSLRDRLGDRIVSRIKGSSKIIELAGADRRR